MLSPPSRIVPKYQLPDVITDTVSLDWPFLAQEHYWQPMVEADAQSVPASARATHEINCGPVITMSVATFTRLASLHAILDENFDEGQDSGVQSS